MLAEKTGLYEASPVSILELFHRPEAVLSKADIPPGTYVPIAYKQENGSVVPQEAIHVDKLKVVDSKFLSQRKEDLYFGLNGVWNVGEQAINGIAKMRPGARKQKNLRTLNTCYIDLDVGRSEADTTDSAKWQSPYATGAAVLDMGERGLLPKPSMIAYSGRGLYVFWLLAYYDYGTNIYPLNELPPPARVFEKDILLFSAVQREIKERLANYAPDAHDASRVLRVPFSIHSKTNRTVEYHPIIVDGGLRYYDLRNLASQLDIDVSDAFCRKKKEPANQKRKRYVPGNLRSLHGLAEKRVRDVRRIAKHHGGFRKRRELYPTGEPSGGRRRSLQFLAQHRFQLGHDREGVLLEVKQLCRTCQPPYPEPNSSDSTPEEIVDTYFGKDGRENIVRYRDVDACRLFGISSFTASDVEALKLETIMPPEIKEQQKSRESASERKKGQQIDYILKRLDELPPGEQHPSYYQLSKELNALGLSCPRPTAKTRYEEALRIGDTSDERLNAAQRNLKQKRDALDIENKRNG